MRAGFKVIEKTTGVNPLGHEAMMREMGRSHFCLAPAGDGYETRMKLALNVGCIPVVIQDEIEVQPSLLSMLRDCRAWFLDGAAA